MTSIVCWVGVDSRGPSSVNIAADSRISWAGHHWDQGRKVFAAVTEPHVFGFYGDVVFPALAIPTLVELLDRRVITLSIAPDWQRPISTALRTLWRGYPDEERRDFGIIHVARLSSGMHPEFRIAIHSYRTRNDTWTHESLHLPSVSSILKLAGSGEFGIRRARDRWQTSKHQKTSRAEYSAFCDALAGGLDPRSGGGPQLVSLYRIGAGRLTGTVFRGRRYLAGRELIGEEDVAGLEWRNELFERCDGRTGIRLADAAIHAKPD